ncbi:MAG: glycoside hydrolase family 88 protein [Bacteroidales bacterium]|nr:glycoside hydrolase family 88 protein [Bacteroidales bacterium]
MLNFLKRISLIALATGLLVSCNSGTEKLQNPASDQPWHILMLEAEMHRNPEAWMLDFESKPKWNYTHGLVLMAAHKVWEETGDQRYMDYIKAYYDDMIDAEGNILHNFSLKNYNIDHIKPGINLFDLYAETGDARYLTALQTLREQLRTHPRTNEGAFWHKNVYPHQLWLDGVYMNTPFYSRYGKVFNEPENFDDVLVQITQVYEKTLDTNTGLLYHAWDESREQAWANPVTGHSPNFWGRAMGWYAMALVDVLDYFPTDHAGRNEITQILNNLMDALLAFQDQETGLWYQVVDQGNREGNYLEASVSCMVAYTLTKAVNNGYLGPEYMGPAQKALQGILDKLVSYDADGYVNLNQICGVAGLGGNPYRDGSYEYYINEIIRSNDPKGVGPFMLLSMEMEKAGLHLAKQ